MRVAGTGVGDAVAVGVMVGVAVAVEDGLITSDDFRDFTFANAVKLCHDLRIRG